MIQIDKKQIFLIVYSVIILVIGYFTYFKNYENPPKLFWDENYHVSSAQKYIDGVMYMEPHPPLGKMIIALGELLLHKNSFLDVKYFSQTDYIKDVPANYSMAGMRLFPTFFAMLNTILFFYILYFILKNSTFAFLLSALYLFDNAMIVHSRAAMLESIQLFFILASLLYFLYMITYKKYQLKDYAILSFFIALNVSVKLNGLIMILLYLFLVIKDPQKLFSLFLVKFFASLSVIVITFLTFMYLHVALGKTMPTHKDYGASAEYKSIIQNGQTANILNFPILLKDNFEYMKNYSKGVPIYNPCKSGGENGSLAYTWPFGNKSINYRWEKKDGATAYLYLMSNPIIWLLGVVGVILSSLLVGARYIYGLSVKNKETFDQITLFVFAYFSYMFVMINIERVMYLYHYFIPLIFSLILFVLILKYLFEEYIQKDDLIMYGSVVTLVMSVVVAYWHFSPLTYFEFIGNYEFMQRIWFDFWQLQFIR